jgi:hypothetical protein
MFSESVGQYNGDTLLSQDENHYQKNRESFSQSASMHKKSKMIPTVDSSIPLFNSGAGRAHSPTSSFGKNGERHLIGSDGSYVQVDNQELSIIKFDRQKDINKQFRFLATIGKGAYGSVVLVESAIDTTDNEIYALKILKQQEKYGSRAEKEEHLRNLQTELEIMIALQGSPFIVKMYGNLYQKNSFYFIMEYINGGDMFFHIRRARAFNIERT